QGTKQACMRTETSVLRTDWAYAQGIAYAKRFFAGGGLGELAKFHQPGVRGRSARKMHSFWRRAMTKIQIEEKYERNGWPSLARPDARPPAGWSLSLITSVNRIHHHQLAPDGRRIAFIWDR